MENLPLIFKRYTSENGGKELLGAVELRLELPGETDVRLGITAITFLVDWGDGESDHSAAHHYEQAGYYRVRVVGTAISQLDVSKCHLTELKLDKCPLLENLNCAYNRLITLELVCCPKLKLLNCSGNRLSVLRSRCNRELVYRTVATMFCKVWSWMLVRICCTYFVFRIGCIPCTWVGATTWSV